MALTSSTYALPNDRRAQAKATKEVLLSRHSGAVEKVVADAKSFSAERKRDLDKIVDNSLRESAKR